MSIEIKNVVALTGTPGLHQIIKADDRAIIVESMDARKRRQMVRGNMMVSKLIDVSIYTDDDSEPLINVLKAAQEKYGEELPVTKRSSKNELMGFLEEILPSYDKERVYPSNVKKLISWYKILNEYEVVLELDEEDDEEAENETDEKVAEVEEEEATEEKTADE